MDNDTLEGVAFAQEKLLAVCEDRDAFLAQDLQSHLEFAKRMFNEAHPGIKLAITLGAWAHSPAHDAYVDDFGNEFQAKEVGVERHYQLRVPHV